MIRALNLRAVMSGDGKDKRKDERMTATKRFWRTACAMLVIGMGLRGPSAVAQEHRKAISHPAPVYPEIAKRMQLAGTVKVQVVIAPDGQIKDTRVIGGHPILVNTVQETLKNWKYATSTSETTLVLEFSFQP